MTPVDILKTSLIVFALAAAHEASAQSVQVPDSVTATQRNALRELRDIRKMSFDEAGVPKYLEGKLGTLRNDERFAVADSTALLSRLRGVLRSDGAEALEVRKISRDIATRKRHYRLDQTIRGLPVIGGEFIVTVDDATDEIVSASLRFLPAAGLPRAARVSADAAQQTAVARLEPKRIEAMDPFTLAYFRKGAQGHLVWQSRVQYTSGDDRSHHDWILVDAVVGSVLEVWPLIHSVLNRSVYDENTGDLLMEEGQAPSNDEEVRCAYDYSGDTYNYFYTRFGRDSWDDSGAPMISHVHWMFGGAENKDTYIVLGNGGGTTIGFGSLACARDIVGHEWTHSVVRSESALRYVGESGALNEAMSDIFGNAIEASVEGVSQNTWMSGERAWTPAVAGDSYRYSYDPRLDGHSRDFYADIHPDDDVHYSSGVGNLAFYLLSNGGTHPRERTTTLVSAIGIEDAAAIFYRALLNMHSDDNYSAARNATALASANLFGLGSFQFLQVCRAWDAVGVPNDGQHCPIAPPEPVPASPVVTASPPNSTGGRTLNWSTVPTATRYEIRGTYKGLLKTVTATSATVQFPVCNADFVYVLACHIRGCSAPSNTTYISGGRPRTGNCP